MKGLSDVSQVLRKGLMLVGPFLMLTGADVQ